MGTNVYRLDDFLRKRDEREAHKELVSYFVEKNNQKRGWYLLLGILDNIQQNVFSRVQARLILEWLSGKFGIKTSAIEYMMAFQPQFFSSSFDGRIRVFHAKTSLSEDVFVDLFLDLQVAVKDGLLEYREACLITKEIIEHYPLTRKCLG